MAGGVAHERIDSVSRVEVAKVAKEGIDSTSRVLTARRVEKQRVDSDSGVIAARGVVLKRACPQAGVTLRRSNPHKGERENDRSSKDEQRPSNVRTAKHIRPSFV